MGESNRMEQEKGIRLNKYIADCGICSRRQADKLIEEGVVCVDGVLGEAGQRLTGKEVVTLNGKEINLVEERVVLAFHKPIGVTCTTKDVHARITVIDYMNYPMRIAYAGRLDKDSEGLLIMTNDGMLIQSLMRGSAYHEKEYVVAVDHEITPYFIQKMADGIYLEELNVTTRPCKVQQLTKYTFSIILTQGLNRQIRRMCEACRYRVEELKRIRVMNIELGTLPEGTYRKIQGEELEILYHSVGMEL